MVECKYTSDGVPIVSRATIETFYRDIDRREQEEGTKAYLLEIMIRIKDQDVFFKKWVDEGMKKAQVPGNNYGSLGHRGFLGGALPLYEIIRRQEEANFQEGSNEPQIIPCKIHLPKFFETLIEERYAAEGDKEMRDFYQTSGPLEVMLEPAFAKKLVENRELGKWILDVYKDSPTDEDSSVGFAIMLGSLHAYEFLRRQAIELRKLE